MPVFTRRSVLLGSLLFALVVAAGWFLLLPRLDVARPVVGPAVEGVYASGTVEPSVMVPIAARSMARLINLNADEGHEVKKGDVLGQLENEDLENALKALQAREEFAKSNAERQEQLFKRGAASKEAGDKAVAELKAARAETEQARAQMGFLSLRAPDDGLIIRRDGEIGQLIPANQPVFFMACCAPLRVTANVDEEDIPRVVAGQKVLIQSDAFPDKVFNGKVQSITPKGDAVSRNYRVRISFDDANVPLLIGMTAETNIVLSNKIDALLIPNSAIASNSVWLVSGNRLVKRKVETGARGTALTEIRAGLTADDFVVLKPKTGLEEGDFVRTHRTKLELPASEK
ncbi:MAG: efflux RND transporter periplasmic adaptor subunit [Pseudomonadota bacterium]